MNRILCTFQPGSEGLARHDLQRESAHRRPPLPLAPGTWLCDGPPLRQPIAIRHQHPVHIERDAPHLDAIVHACRPLLADLPPNQSWAVQTRQLSESPLHSFAINDALAALGQAPYDRRRPENILSVTLNHGRLYAGLSPASANLSPWPGGAMRLAARPEIPSRSARKLEEAIATFDLKPTGMAIDLGAAPGGWTAILLEHGLQVIAVDPARLDPDILRAPGLTYHRKTAEAYLRQPGPKVDLLVNDMKMDAIEAAELLVSAKAHLKPGALLLTTLKLPRERAEQRCFRALEILDAHYHFIGARQLFYNRQEVTALYRQPD